MVKAIKYEVDHDCYLAEYAVPEGIRICDHNSKGLVLRLEVWGDKEVTATLLDSNLECLIFEEVCKEFFLFSLKCVKDFSESVRRHKKFGV